MDNQTNSDGGTNIGRDVNTGGGDFCPPIKKRPIFRLSAITFHFQPCKMSTIVNIPFYTLQCRPQVFSSC